MSKIQWKPGTMLYPVPAVLVTSRFNNRDNIITLSWVGTICTNPPMLSISIRPERYSYTLIKKSMEFVVNIPSVDLTFAVDYCGVKSGKNIDKFKQLGLHQEKAFKVNAPLIKESPVSIECKVKKIIPLGSHDMFISEVICVDVDPSLIDSKKRFHLENIKLLCYNHGHYCYTSKPIGKFGYSVKKKK